MNAASLSVVSNASDVARTLRNVRERPASVGFVPTMGALHAGHGALIERAREENEFLVVSIFVNPLQFDRKQDLDGYPHELEKDLSFCEKLHVDLVYAPSSDDLYPRPQFAYVEVPALERFLCGQFRPGHFRGVATVVLKLLNIVHPDRAYLGEKDAQQLAIIRRMVEDLNVPVQIVSVATVREPDGLALSSRNVRLTPAQREIAPLLHQALLTTAELMTAGETAIDAVRQRATAHLAAEPALKLEYFEVCDPDTLAPLSEVHASALIAGAMLIGETRLIDNLFWQRSLGPKLRNSP